MYLGSGYSGLKVLTVGVYDYFHLGHLRLFQKARALGDFLIVAVQDEDYIRKYKPQSEIMYSTQERVEIISSLKVVDKVIIYYDVDKIVETTDFDVFAIGEDQKHGGFQKAVNWCENNGKKVVRMTRTPNISSTAIKNNKHKWLNG